MTPYPVSAPADLSTEAGSLLLAQRGGAVLFVVDEGGRPIGTIARSELIQGADDSDEEPVSQVRNRIARRAAEDDDDEFPSTAGQSARRAAAANETSDARRPSARSLGEIMSPVRICLDQQMSIAQAAQALALAGARRAPVVDGEGRLVGLLTSSLARLLAGPGPGRLGGALRSATLRTIEAFNRAPSSPDAVTGDDGPGESWND